VIAHASASSNTLADNRRTVTARPISALPDGERSAVAVGGEHERFTARGSRGRIVGGSYDPDGGDQEEGDDDSDPQPVTEGHEIISSRIG
jgi:hypothetical protein